MKQQHTVYLFIYYAIVHEVQN